MGILPGPDDLVTVAPAGPGTGRGPMVPVPYRVTARDIELPDTLTLEIEPVAEALAPPAAGQFNMLWAFGVGEVPISVSHLGEPGGPTRHTVRAVGAVTRALCALEPGAMVGVRGPFGRGWDLASAVGSDVVVVAGGLGLAPLRPVVDEIIARRDDFGRVALLIGARSPEDLLYGEALGAWRARFDLDVAVTVDHAGPGWHGDVGVVTRLIPRLAVDPGSAAAFVCGPEIMMRFAGTALADAGLAPGRIQVSLERNMVCGIAHCGHCQLGPTFLCREGPVYRLDDIAPMLGVRAL